MNRRHKNHLAGIPCAVLCNITIIHCFSTQNSFRFKLEKKNHRKLVSWFLHILTYMQCFLTVLSKINNEKYSWAAWSGKTWLSLVRMLQHSSAGTTGASGATLWGTPSQGHGLWGQAGEVSPGTEDPWGCPNQYCSGWQHYPTRSQCLFMTILLFFTEQKEWSWSSL